MNTASGVCVCVCVHCSRCVCMCVCVCVLGWVKYREQNFTAGYTLYNCICDKKNKKNKISVIVFFLTRYPIMVKYLNIRKNIGKPIYRSISKKNQRVINFQN